MDFVHTPNGMRPKSKGFSHGLKSVHRTLFTPTFVGVGLSNPIIAIKNTEAKASVFFMGWIMGFEPTTFRATI